MVTSRSSASLLQEPASSTSACSSGDIPDGLEGDIEDIFNLAPKLLRSWKMDSISMIPVDEPEGDW